MYLSLFLLASPAAAGLEEDLGRNEVRVYSAPYRVPMERTVAQTGLAERLERLGYQRVHRRPERPGEFFWGHERFWLFQRDATIEGFSREAALVGLNLGPADGRILSVVQGERNRRRQRDAVWLEPELLAESLEANRVPRRLVSLSQIPEHIWRPVLAAEDHRFFDHQGVDARSIARALLKNLKAGRVTQGGSTITQQLVKMREMSPSRTLGRKASEAARALALEAEYDKQEILGAYLNSVYLGHVERMGVYGFGAASRTYFSRTLEDLSLGEAAALAAMVQGPNWLSILKHPQRLEVRRRWILSRMEELGWATDDQLEKAARIPQVRLEPPVPPRAPHFVRWIGEEVGHRQQKRLDRGRGVIVNTSLDPLLQAWAEKAVESGLRRLVRRRAALRAQSLNAALVALDRQTGEVLAYVGGDPRARGDAFDRARRARRQPGSTIKPLVLLEALAECGGRAALYPSRQVRDEALRIQLPSGSWEPRNSDGRFRGVVSIRQALVDSLNVPFVRLARWCGLEPTARRMRRTGITISDELPPAFVLGALEVTPLELVSAYTLFANGGRRLKPQPFREIRRPAGWTTARGRTRGGKVVSSGVAFLIYDMLREAVEKGTASAAGVEGLELFGKTGTSSERRDAWFVGGGGSVVAVVWVGVDEGASLGFSGSQAAAPIWREFMAQAVGTRRSSSVSQPATVMRLWVQESTGLLVGAGRRGARQDLFLRKRKPPRRRWYRGEKPIPPI